jgi:short-subunit dehydrogenase
MEKVGLLKTWENPGVALVTGASSGIGAEFARQLAVQGFSPVLVARREDRLKALAEEIQQASGVKPEVLVADLATKEGISHVETRIKKTDNLDVLVNDAGFSLHGKFFEVDIGPQLEMLSVHVLAPVRFCRAAIEMMLSRKRGAIINVASINAFLPSEGTVMYNSTKAFLKAFSQNIAMDLHGKRIKVQALCPGFTDTEIFYVGYNRTRAFDRSDVPDSLWMTAKECVSQSLVNLGRGSVVFVPGERNRELLARAGVKLD